jgi:hypothetical protein
MPSDGSLVVGNLVGSWKGAVVEFIRHDLRSVGIINALGVRISFQKK